MADNRTMAQMLQAPIEGYEDAIVIPPINANNFELKQPLINLVQSNKFTCRSDPTSHLRFLDNKVTSTFRHPEVPNTSVKLLLFPFSLDGEARDWTSDTTADCGNKEIASSSTPSESEFEVFSGKLDSIEDLSKKFPNITRTHDPSLDKEHVLSFFEEKHSSLANIEKEIDRSSEFHCSKLERNLLKSCGDAVKMQ
ncbi:hypothetical protein Tco_0089271 [Tanacetum coccineum]